MSELGICLVVKNHVEFVLFYGAPTPFKCNMVPEEERGVWVTTAVAN
jgi:hypothetical protein